MNDRTQPPGTAPMDVVSDQSPRQRMRRLRKHLLPLQSESISPIDLPSVRTGLLTKLNALTVGLIALTGLAISAYYFWQQWSNEGSELRQRGRTIAAVFAEQSEFGVYTVGPRVARAHARKPRARSRRGVRDRAGSQAVADRRATLRAPLGNEPIPALPASFAPPKPGRMLELEPTIDGRRYLELVAPIGQPQTGAFAAIADAAAETSSRTQADDGLPIGYLRLGVSFERQREEMTAQALGTLTVVLLLTVVAVIASLFVTRRLVAPMRRLMRAARAVGAGRLDVYVPASTADELGLLTQTFNHMTQRLSESQAEVANYQRTLEEKVAQRTKELEVATAHAYKLAQHDILTGLPNRSLLNARLRQIFAQAQRSGCRSRAFSSTSTTSSASTTRSATTPATSCCSRSRSG